MFMRYIMFVGVVSIAAAGLAACSPSNTPPTAQAVSSSQPVAWDYTMRQYNSADHIYLEKQLDSMGALGWECYQMYYTGMGPWFFFKRPISE